mmetsp:Transcript_5560/g.7859  ORF Transcript_5560/g.7859 Transcript_5560/m.7859 type:complete len:198 (-) Transcript_5560:102-695(-)
MTEVVKFDIGGQLYKVSRSLLEKHPESMLTKSASEQWQEDSEAEIFIERDGFRFRYILDYMRDDKVTLPRTESREMIIAELEYYGITVKEDGIIDPLSMKEFMMTLNGDIEKSGEEFYAARVAVKCVSKWYDSSSGGFTASRESQIAIYSDNSSNELCTIQPDQGKREASVNTYLNQIGLKIVGLRTPTSNFIVKEI